MASKHYPTMDGPTEPVRTLAGELLWELDRAGDAGIMREELPCSDWASAATFHRAIRWLRNVGVDVECVAGRYRLAHGTRRTMPAHAMSRVDLLDSLRGLLGADVDPLEAIAALLGRETWVRTATGYEREADGYTWRLYTGDRLVSLRAVVGEHVAVSRTWDRGSMGHRECQEMADDIIAGWQPAAKAVEQMRELGAVGSW